MHASTIALDLSVHDLSVHDLSDRASSNDGEESPVASTITEPADDLPRQSSDELQSFTVGIKGHYRVGQWTGIRLKELPHSVAAVDTVDGDGVRVSYHQPESPGGDWLYAVPGAISAPLSFRDAAQAVVVQSQWEGQAVEPRMPWIVAFGNPLGMESIGRNDLLNREATVAVSVIRQSIDLPDQAIGYSGVDLLIIGPSSIGTLKSINETQGKAIVGWVRQGGRMVVSLGTSASEMIQAAPWLAPLLPVDKNVKSTRIEPSGLENYTSSQSPLPILEGAQLPDRGGMTLLTGRNVARQLVRLAVESNFGFGRVIVVAPSLDSAEMEQWPQRTQLVTRLVGSLFESELTVRRDSRTGTAVSYDDFAGQVRNALDQFDSKRRVPYSFVSILVVALAVLIGPIDYLIINRVFGKPLLGWLTFPFYVCGLSALLIWLGRPVSNPPGADVKSLQTVDISKSVPKDSPRSSYPNQPYSNRIEIVDIDATRPTAIGRGFSWSYLSADDATIVDYPGLLSETVLMAEHSKSSVTAPFGYAGKTFGGISIAGEDRRLPGYHVTLSIDPDGRLGSQISDIPLCAGGSKGIVSRWTFSPKLSGESNLSRRRGNELLAGSVTNSLPVDILNGALVFGEWVYLLPTRFRSGETIPSIETLRQKNFRWLLARREALENSSRSEPWNVEMSDDFPRLVELLMFESTVGGRDYTGLQNRPLADLDLSYWLHQETAILFGQMEQPAVASAFPVQRASVSAVRLMLKVSPPRLSALTP